jgi:hypothetical protein
MHSIMTLKRITTLNLSDNPLCTLSLEAWKHRFLENSFFLRSIKFRQIRLSPEISNEISVLLERAKAIDIS